jgi:hypothetical protein
MWEGRNQDGGNFFDSFVTLIEIYCEFLKPEVGPKKLRMFSIYENGLLLLTVALKTRDTCHGTIGFGLIEFNPNLIEF